MSRVERAGRVVGLKSVGSASGEGSIAVARMGRCACRGSERRDGRF